MEEKRASFYHRAWRRFKKNSLGRIGLGIVCFLIMIAWGAPVIALYNPNEIHLTEIWGAPSFKNPLGQDELGRDIYSRLIWGTRISLQIGIFSAIIMLMIGVTLGSISGYFGGIIDNIIMRITDILLTLPTIFLLILATSLFKERGIYMIIMVIGLLRWPTLARITRAEFLSLKERKFVDAARSSGASDIRIIFKHIFPNTLPPIIITSTINIASAILSEAGLSYLGLGDPTVVSWGKMLSRGLETLRVAWWAAIIPGLAIFFTVLGFNLLGDSLRDAFDIKQ